MPGVVLPQNSYTTSGTKVLHQSLYINLYHTQRNSSGMIKNFIKIIRANDMNSSPQPTLFRAHFLATTLMV